MFFSMLLLTKEQHNRFSHDEVNVKCIMLFSLHAELIFFVLFTFRKNKN